MSVKSVMENSPIQPLDYRNEVFKQGLHYVRPRISFNPSKWQPDAEAYMSTNATGYVSGNAGTGSTTENNSKAFAKWGIVPRRLAGMDVVPNLSTTVLGKTRQFPIALAPVGVQRIFNPDGELAAAAAAEQTGVPYIMSTASSYSIEDVARANGNGERWFQLYWPANQHNDITVSMLERAKRNGFTALFVTLDTYALGWRPTDLDHGYNPFLRPDDVGVAIGFTDPVFRRHFRSKHGIEVEEDESRAAPEWSSIIFPTVSHSWEDVRFLQQHWDGPIILKGIQCVEDAEKCVELGLQGLVISNHGGRQTDGCVGSLTMLPEIVARVGDKCDIFFDSGIRSGADIAKAMALGAKMCLIGRPYVYGLALGGKEGVKHVVMSLLGDLQMTLHLSGIPSAAPGDLNRSRLRWLGETARS